MSNESRRGLRNRVTLVVFGMLLLLAACSKESKQTQSVQSSSLANASSSGQAASDASAHDNALVRVVAAIPGGPSVDVSANDKIVFPKLTYKTVTKYQELPDQRLTFKVRLAGEVGQPLAENSEGLAGGNHYTLVAYDKGSGKTELAAFSDNLTPPSEGKAKVRVINAAPEAGDVDVYAVGREVLFTGLDTGEDSRYSEVDPINVTLQIRPKGKQNTLLNVENMQFEPGGIYTIVVIGNAEPSPPLSAIRIEDRLQGIPSAELR